MWNRWSTTVSSSVFSIWKMHGMEWQQFHGVDKNKLKSFGWRLANPFLTLPHANRTILYRKKTKNLVSISSFVTSSSSSLIHCVYLQPTEGQWQFSFQIVERLGQITPRRPKTAWLTRNQPASSRQLGSDLNPSVLEAELLLGIDLSCHDWG